MAERPKGNIYYEILIAVLAIVLIGTILYPTNVWKGESDIEKVCHTRMEAIQQLEIRYISLNEPDFIYTDNLSKLRDVVLSDPEASVYLDSVVLWDYLVTSKDLQTIVGQRQFPEELRSHIHEKITEGKPLVNLTRWDSLGNKLVKKLKGVLAEADVSQNNPLDSAVTWHLLASGNDFYQILDSTEVSRNIKNRTRLAVRDGRSIIETSGWKYFRSNFYRYLGNTIDICLREMVWTSDDKDQWEEAREKEFADELSTLSQEEKDTLWVQIQGKIWDKEKEVIWRKEQKNLWKEEKNIWMTENETTWRRILNERWEKDRRGEWEEEMKKTLKPLPPVQESSEDSTIVAEPDTTPIDSAWVFLEIFQEKKRELWRTVVDTLRSEEFDIWRSKNKNETEKIIQDLWTGSRRISWEEEYYPIWSEEQEKDKKAMWERIVEENWILEKDKLWEEEMIQGEQKKEALKRLDNTVVWSRALDNAWLESMIDQLQLPNNKEVIKALKKENKGDKSGLYNLGLVGLYKDVLLDSIARCPLASAPYLIQTNDTMAVKLFHIECPIQEAYIYNDTNTDSTKKIAAIRVDPVTHEKTKSILKISLFKKLFGGGKMKSHGGIYETDEKSWEKKET